MSRKSPRDPQPHRPAAALIGIATADVMASILSPVPAMAHVKWFVPYDVTATPTPVSGVLTSHFLMLFAGFLLAVLGGILFDRYIAGRWKFIVQGGNQANIEEWLLRAGMAAFFMALFSTGGVILTPELHTDADWPAWLQLGIAISLLSSRTCLIGGAGIAVLYAYGARLYGVFHLADYPMFLGIAGYLVLTSLPSERLRSLRMPILYVTLCMSLMWGAIEKWAYPQWTLSLLELRPYLAAGLPHEDFLLFAGFVEFALAFYILAGFSLVRPAILGLLTIFAAAILDFGTIDAVGHLPIMAPLLVMFIHGPTRLHRWFHEAGNTAFSDAHKVGVAFATSICLFFAFYYGLQYDEYGHPTHERAVASVQMSHTHQSN
jgi:hypothetical protein